MRLVHRCSLRPTAALFGEAKLREAALLSEGRQADRELCIAVACALLTYILPLLPVGIPSLIRK